jgi:glycosyltransferase involved in cell wall biosynthesis
LHIVDKNQKLANQMDIASQKESYFASKDFQCIPAIEISDINADFRPLVSVLMITWNHESYIDQAIESILNQQCEFPFELIIGEDCSWDRTRAICAYYQQRFLENIRLIVSDKNVGMHRNLARIWYRARGKYIAFCEGDDYWIDSEKLAKQIDRMEARPEFTLCGTYTQKIIKEENGSWTKAGMVGPSEIKDQYTLEDLIPNYSFHFSSVMVRKESLRFPRWFWDVYCADRPLYLLCAEKGPVSFIPQTTSIYRMHGGGIWVPTNQLDKARKGIKLFEVIDRYFDYQYNKLIRRTLGNILWSYMSEALINGDRTSAKTLFWQSMRYQCPKINSSRLTEMVSVMLHLYLPFLYNQIRNLKVNHLHF